MVVEKDDKLILLTNDDGLYAAGLRTLLGVMEEFGKVVLISTTESMSGMSQALTVKTPLMISTGSMHVAEHLLTVSKLRSTSCWSGFRTGLCLE